MNNSNSVNELIANILSEDNDFVGPIFKFNTWHAAPNDMQHLLSSRCCISDTSAIVFQLGLVPDLTQQLPVTHERRRKQRTVEVTQDREVVVMVQVDKIGNKSASV